MSCVELKQVAHDYFTGELSPDGVKRIEAHVDGCSDCQDFRAICLEISCRELIDFLHEYIDGELEPARRKIFERHLSICEDCTNYLAAYRRTIEISALAVKGPVLPEQPVPEELVRAILAARLSSDTGDQA